MCNHFQQVLISILCLVLPNMYLKDSIVQGSGKKKISFSANPLCSKEIRAKKKGGKRVNQNRKSHNSAGLHGGCWYRFILQANSSRSQSHTKHLSSLADRPATWYSTQVWTRVWGRGSGAGVRGCLSWIPCYSAGEGSEGITRQKCPLWKIFIYPSS